MPCHHLLSLTDIILDIAGYLEGEAIIREYIPAFPLSWSRLPRVVLPESEQEAVKHIEDWRAPIIELWNSSSFRILIKSQISGFDNGHIGRSV